MRQAWNQFYRWAHTERGDLILCAAGMLLAMMSARALMWLVIGMGV